MLVPYPVTEQNIGFKLVGSSKSQVEWTSEKKKKQRKTRELGGEYLKGSLLFPGGVNKLLIRSHQIRVRSRHDSRQATDRGFRLPFILQPLGKRRTIMTFLVSLQNLIPDISAVCASGVSTWRKYYVRYTK